MEQHYCMEYGTGDSERLFPCLARVPAPNFVALLCRMKIY